MSSRTFNAAVLALCAAAIATGGATGADATSLVCGAVAVLGLGLAAAGGLRAAPRDAVVVAGAWALVGAASTFWSVDRDASLDASARWLASCLLFVLAAGSLRSQGRAALGVGLAALGALVACAAIAWTPLGTRARAPFANPNHLAAWLVLPTALAACEVVRTNVAQRGRRERAFLWFGLFGIVGAGVAATQSLGAGLAALGAMGGLALLRAMPPHAATSTLAAGWLALATVLALVPVLAPSLVAAHDGLGESSPGLRWQIYAAAARVAWQAMPLGVGLGGFGAAFAAQRPVGVAYAVDHAHADALQGVAELGLPFLLLLGATCAWVARRAARGIAHGRFDWSAGIALLALALHALVDFPVQVPAIALTAAALAGACVSAWQPPDVGDRPGGPTTRSLRATQFCVVSLGIGLAFVTSSLALARHAERRADALLAAGDFADAETAARGGLRLRPWRPALLARLAEACEAEAQLGSGGSAALARALDARWRAADARPLDAQTRSALAGTRALAGDLAGALDDARRASILDPASPAPRIALAQLLLAAGRSGEAASAIHAALERHPRAADGLLEALLQASADPDLVALAAPDDAATRRSAGRVLARAGFSRLAARALARSLELSPGDADVALEAARQFARSGDPLGAEGVLTRTLERLPNESRLETELARLREQSRAAPPRPLPGAGTS